MLRSYNRVTPVLEMKHRELIRVAGELGWEITKGTKHYKLYHPATGKTTILPYGRKHTPRKERNMYSRLRSVVTKE